MKALPRVVLSGAAMALSACSGSGALDARDVYAIVDEVDVAARAEALVEPTLLLASGFGNNASSPEDAATRLTDALTDAPCITTVRDGASVSIVYSVAEYGCDISPTLYAVLALSGQQTVTYVQADGASTTIDHAWKGVTNGYLTVDGAARVTTAATAYGSSQHLVNALAWVRASDGKSGHGQDDRTSPTSSSMGQQVPPPTGLRTWESDAGSWEMRSIDARMQSANAGIPFIGTYAIVTPEMRALTLSIADDSNGARMTLTDGNRSYSFGLSTNGGAPSGSP